MASIDEICGSQQKEVGESGASATIKTFEITKLLEWILLYLPLRDILLAKRASRAFRDVIDGSFKIKQALFFQPLPGFIKLRDKTIEQEITPANRIIEMPWPPLAPDLCESNPFEVHGSQFSLLKGLYPKPNLQKLAESDEIASWRRMLVMQPIPGLTGLTCSANVEQIEWCMTRGLTMEKL